MKIVTWAIIFVVVIFAFSFGNRLLLSNKMEIIKQEVKYNNAIDQATEDATTRLMNQMINLNQVEEESQYILLSAIDNFFDTFSLSLGYYGGERKLTNTKMYVPLILVLTDDGFYNFTEEEIDKSGEKYIEHTLKPEVPYSSTLYSEDYNTRAYINYTIDNRVKIYSDGSFLEGDVVDLRHDERCNEVITNQHRTETLADGTDIDFIINAGGGVYQKDGTYKGKTIRYKESIVPKNEVNYLQEEWYVEDLSKPVYVRETEYSNEDVLFTRNVQDTLTRNHLENCEFLWYGNPENNGLTDPFTGKQLLGDFNIRRKSAISNNIITKSEEYILRHNNFARLNGISYTFTLPEVEDTDWNNAIQDLGVIAFVQGMPLAGETYYNNYSLSGARIIRRETFLALPTVRQNNISTLSPDADNFPKYYSSYGYSLAEIARIENQGAITYYSAQEAAANGYFPVFSKFAENDKIIVNNNIYDVDLDLKYESGADVAKTAGTVRLRYNIDVTNKSDFSINKIAYMRVGDVDSKGSINATNVLNNGTQIGTMAMTGTFDVNANGRYAIAIRERGTGKIYVATKIVDNFDTADFNIDVYQNANAESANIVVKVTAGSSRLSKIYYTNGSTEKTINITDDISAYSFELTQAGDYTIIAYSGTGTYSTTKTITVEPFNGIKFNITAVSLPDENEPRQARIVVQVTDDSVDMAKLAYSGPGVSSKTINLTNPVSSKSFVVSENGTYTINATSIKTKNGTYTKTVKVKVDSIVKPFLAFNVSDTYVRALPEQTTVKVLVEKGSLNMSQVSYKKSGTSEWKDINLINDSYCEFLVDENGQYDIRVTSIRNPDTGGYITKQASYNVTSIKGNFFEYKVAAVRAWLDEGKSTVTLETEKGSLNFASIYYRLKGVDTEWKTLFEAPSTKDEDGIIKKEVEVYRNGIYEFKCTSAVNDATGSQFKDVIKTIEIMDIVEPQLEFNVTDEYDDTKIHQSTLKVEVAKKSLGIGFIEYSINGGAYVRVPDPEPGADNRVREFIIRRNGEYRIRVTSETDARSGIVRTEMKEIKVDEIIPPSLKVKLACNYPSDDIYMANINVGLDDDSLNILRIEYRKKGETEWKLGPVDDTGLGMTNATFEVYENGEYEVRVTSVLDEGAGVQETKIKNINITNVQVPKLDFNLTNIPDATNPRYTTVNVTTVFPSLNITSLRYQREGDTTWKDVIVSELGGKSTIDVNVYLNGKYTFEVTSIKEKHSGIQETKRSTITITNVIEPFLEFNVSATSVNARSTKLNIQNVQWSVNLAQIKYKAPGDTEWNIVSANNVTNTNIMAYRNGTYTIEGTSVVDSYTGQTKTYTTTYDVSGITEPTLNYSVSQVFEASSPLIGKIKIQLESDSLKMEKIEYRLKGSGTWKTASVSSTDTYKEITVDQNGTYEVQVTSIKDANSKIQKTITKDVVINCIEEKFTISISSQNVSEENLNKNIIVQATGGQMSKVEIYNWRKTKIRTISSSEIEDGVRAVYSTDLTYGTIYVSATNISGNQSVSYQKVTF